MFSSVARGLPPTHLLDVHKEVPDGWELRLCMEIKSIDDDIEGTETIFDINTVFTEKLSNETSHPILPRMYVEKGGCTGSRGMAKEIKGERLREYA